MTNLADAAMRVLGPMVPGFSFRGWAPLSTLVVRRLRAGERVFAEGDTLDAFYGVVDGEMSLVFATALLSEVARRLGDALAQLQSARHQSAEERLALAIGAFARSTRAEVEGRGVLLRVSQAELAEAAALSRQSTNEILRRWVKQGVARCGYRTIWVADKVTNGRATRLVSRGVDRSEPLSSPVRS